MRGINADDFCCKYICSQVRELKLSENSLEPIDRRWCRRCMLYALRDEQVLAIFVSRRAKLLSGIDFVQEEME